MGILTDDERLEAEERREQFDEYGISRKVDGVILLGEALAALKELIDRGQHPSSMIKFEWQGGPFDVDTGWRIETLWTVKPCVVCARPAVGLTSFGEETFARAETCMVHGDPEILAAWFEEEAAREGADEDELTEEPAGG